MQNSRVLGIALVLIGATLWGVSGTVAQFLFQEKGFSTEWLTVIRLLVAGVVLLSLAHLKEGTKVWAVWRSKNGAMSIILFGILGMLAVQYTYFAAIEHGNAATATILQYLAPAIITCYLSLRFRRLPSFTIILSVVIAIIGTFLLVTGGNLQSLSISGWAVFWGIASAFALSFYTLQPLRLLADWGAKIVVGWGMLIGGVTFSFIHPPWQVQGEWTLSSVVAVLFVIIFGTIIAFYFYLESTTYIAASKVSLLASVEPLSATFLSILWFHIPFGLAEWIGTILILATITTLSIVKDDRK
ncbi:DMT family transporter [Terribacillus saccharophilus]|uniref:Threonine/homoserine efflux transporter RhtA n=1 Tax=Terribacillus saccharophilus TaxID=361277 RepID=A0AAX2E9K0_9BACI|nr:EamA family transporter [Terribacillus goriensis]MEC0283796.1 EamA family transporter [Terribacillus saccharophilus]MEC0290752.1 EamA family transporter [Terribacillus saccharophilus]SEM49641.1 Threonine/homoserine efflux transporter RhtA [Terribacillus saccharophilus]